MSLLPLLALIGAAAAVYTGPMPPVPQIRAPGVAPSPPTSSVIAHLFEWSWEDVALECETFLGPAGYAAVQVSPPQEDIGGNAWWTRYQPVSHKLVSRSGDERAFADMVWRCNAAGVGVIVDAVLNHMAGAPASGGQGRAGTPYGPGCRRFPEMFSCDDFHHNSGDCCSNCQVDTDTDLWRIQNCDLGLPDLATGSDWVQQKLAEYLGRLADLNVTGVRVDAAKHIPAQDLRAIVGRTGRQLSFNLEIIIPPWQPCAVDIQNYYDIGRVWEFKLPRLLSDAFKPADRRLDLLLQVGQYSGAQWASPERAISFASNHDLLVHGPDRLNTVTFFDGPLYQLALAFVLAHPFGQPAVLSSLVFGPGQLDGEGSFSGAPVDGQGRLLPVHGPDGELNCSKDKPYLCEHRWPAVAAMVRWRRVAGTQPINTIQALNSNAAIALARGPPGGRSVAFLLINAAWKEGGEVRQRFPVGLPPGMYCNVLSEDGCSSPVLVGGDGIAELAVPLLSALALHVEAVAPSSA